MNKKGLTISLRPPVSRTFTTSPTGWKVGERIATKLLRIAQDDSRSFTDGVRQR